MPLNDALRQRTHSFALTLNAHRIFIYTLISLVAVSVAVANALKNYSNFYSVAIYLSKSSRSVLVLANFAFLIALLCGHIVQKIFFGSLRANEVERLYDRLWFFITESLLAFTIFRDEFDIPFALMFGFLLFVKSFHWLASDRIEWMDQRPYPGPSPLFHARMSTLFLILWTTDFVMFLIAVENTISYGVGGMVLFASEYGILMASVVNAICKYLLSAYELRRAGRRGGANAPPWENKSMWVFYIELSTDFLKLTTYLVFFTIIITFYGLPLNIVRDVYITARSFVARLRALHRYQAATRNMDQRYPNATEAELSAMSDRTCIICREEMVLHEAAQTPGQAPVNSDGPNTTPKKLPCGHVFHFHCLRSWLERQQSCPTCRRTVLDANAPPADGVPAPPQAPAVPPHANPFVLPGAQNQNAQRMNNPLGNPLGLMGRLFGPQAQPPIVPGQFGAGQIPQIPNVPQLQGLLAGQHPPGVIIQYHIQYQVPRQQPHQNTPQNLPPQALQPAPQFPGFMGPRGVWQQWPANELIAPQNLDPTPTVAAQAQPQEVQPASSPALGENTVSPNDSPSTPREAAALAALRRMNDGRQSGNESTSSGRGGAEVTASPASSSNATSELPAPSSSTTMPVNNYNVPQLIPLYDYSRHNTALANPSQYPGDGIAPPTFLQPLNTPRNLQQAQAPSAMTSSQAVLPEQHAQHQQEHLLHTSQFPPNLTDSQLALMDTVTREAIDERLRILEGVSGAVYRCIDDLMRMRSALPSPNLAASSNAAPSPSPVDLSASHPADVSREPHDVEVSHSPGKTVEAVASSSGMDTASTETSANVVVDEALNTASTAPTTAD